ncbi:hypothetical protein TeGR_g3176 [Tetraparma gracilis]|uniref:F-box domain-containing protein n=1 Tax=Tetraparma gracilis TaxID=2962635 RepID=A0ABQ6M9C4_9STRA|nr:hypothetical protein TeGR_g3176 [Tetraparma gracilis]
MPTTSSSSASAPAPPAPSSYASDLLALPTCLLPTIVSYLPPPDQRAFLPLLSLDEAREVRLSREPLLLASRGSVKLTETEHCPEGSFSAYLPALEAYAREKRDSTILSFVAGVYHHGNLYMGTGDFYQGFLASETGALVSLPVLGGVGSRVLFAVAISDVLTNPSNDHWSMERGSPYLDSVVVRAYLPCGSSVRLFWTQWDNKPAHRAITCDAGDAARVATALGLAQTAELGSVLRVVVGAALGHEVWASHVTQVLPGIESSFPEHGLEPVDFASYKAVGGKSYRLREHYMHGESKRKLFDGVKSTVELFADGAFDSLMKLEAALKFRDVSMRRFNGDCRSSWQEKVEHFAEEGDDHIIPYCLDSDGSDDDSVGSSTRYSRSIHTMITDALIASPEAEAEDYSAMFSECFEWEGGRVGLFE